MKPPLQHSTASAHRAKTPRASGGPRASANNSAAAKQARILRVAASTFARRGFAHTTMEDIAKAAGVAKGTLYLYFRSKQELFVQMVLFGMNRVHQMIKREASKMIDPRKRLERAMDIMFRALRQYEETTLLTEVPKFLSANDVMRIKRAGFGLVDQFESIIKQCQRLASLRGRLNPRVLAMTVVGGLAGYAHGWLELKESLPPPDEYLCTYKRLLWIAIYGERAPGKRLKEGKHAN